jgi:type I restriction enzyme M protein
MPAPDLHDIARRLFRAAETLWTNTGLRPDQYAQPVLALIALRQMEAKFLAVDAELRPTFKGRLKPTPAHYQSRGAMFVPEASRFSRLLALPGNANLGAELNTAMDGVEEANPELSGVLPRGYAALPNNVLSDLLRLLSPLHIEGDAYRLIFEYFMGEFAAAFMQKGGEYFTPASIVKLIVEIIEPFHGTILDPACGSGGMFVHSAEFVKRHHKTPDRELAIYGVEKMSDTLKLCRLNLAVHGLSGDIREANTYYDDPHKLVGRFDFLMSNPPFNQSDFDRTRLVNETGKPEVRFPLGLPTVNNANYLWINIFYAALNQTGRAGFVMANSASDAGGSERELRRRLVETGVVDCIVAVGPNMFFTVTLPVTLWFLDRAKEAGKRKHEVLFVNAQHLYRQVTRVHRVFDAEHIEFIANIIRLWRDEPVETDAGSGPRMKDAFPTGNYKDVPGLCRIATITEIADKVWSLNPGRYVGIAPGEKPSDEEFRVKLEELQEELDSLNGEAGVLQAQIAQNVADLLSGI